MARPHPSHARAARLKGMAMNFCVRTSLKAGLILILWTGFAIAQVTSLPVRVFDGPISLVTGHIAGDLTSGRLDLSGGVLVSGPNGILRMGGATLRGESLSLHGPISLQYGTTSLLAQQAHLHRANRQFKIQNLYIRQPNRHASLRELSQDGSGRLNATHILYSPCVNCRYRRAPWTGYVGQLSYDPKTEQIQVRDAQISIFDVPVLQIPFWQFANLQVSRLSGYLQPRLAASEYGGRSLHVDRFWDLGETRDITAGLALHQHGGLGGHLRYRYADPRRRYSADLRALQLDSGGDAYQSLQTQDQTLLGLGLRFDHFLTDRWRIRGSGQFETNDEFALRFSENPRKIRTAFAEAEYFNKETYGQIRLSRDLRTPDAKTAYDQAALPTRLSLVLSHKLRPFEDQRVAVSLNQDLEISHRAQGRQSARLASTARISSGRRVVGAHDVQIGGFARHILAYGDGLDLNSDDYAPTGSTFSGTSDFSLYGMDLDWSLPLSASSGLHIIPRARLSFVGGTPPDGRLANEDSQLSLLSAATLFRPVDQGAVDRGFTGKRLDVGFEAGQVRHDWSLTGFAGLRYQDGFSNHSPSFSGQVNGSSAALIQLQADHWDTGLALAYLGRLPLLDASQRSHDLRVSMPLRNWQASLAYAYETQTTEMAGGEIWSLNLNGPLSETWQAEISMSDDLQNSSESQIGLKLGYRDCCLGLNFYIDLDENGGNANRTWGVEVDLIGLTTVGNRNSFSF